jgi:hypothetical protein
MEQNLRLPNKSNSIIETKSCCHVNIGGEQLEQLATHTGKLKIAQVLFTYN